MSFLNNLIGASVGFFVSSGFCFISGFERIALACAAFAFAAFVGVVAIFLAIIANKLGDLDKK